MLKNEFIDSLKNAQVSIYSLADQNRGHCDFKGKLVGFFVVKVLKSSYKLKIIHLR